LVDIDFYFGYGETAASIRIDYGDGYLAVCSQSSDPSTQKVYLTNIHVDIEDSSITSVSNELDDWALCLATNVDFENESRVITTYLLMSEIKAPWIVTMNSLTGLATTSWTREPIDLVGYDFNSLYN
jgi:hypothetical protein